MMEVKVTVNEKRMICKKGDLLIKVIKSEAPCGGRGMCGKCRVKAKGRLSPVTSRERELLSPDELKAGIRLACLTYIEGDCEVETEIKADAIIAEADLSVPDAACPSFKRHGIAVDIGTTTLGARLYDTKGKILSVASSLNPQIRWGSDVVTRIESAVNGKADEMRRAVVSGINKLISELAVNTQISPTLIDFGVITGNTTMLSIFCGKSVEGLSHAPFTMDFPFGKSFSAHELGLILHETTEIYIPPCISPFVGADTTCAIIASELCDKEYALLADIGTNGELCLIKNGKLLVTSTAAGPAFEGVGITCGMRAQNGAIDSVKIINNSLTVHAIGDTEPRGLCGAGLIEATAALLELDVIDETGSMEEKYYLSKNVYLTQRDIRNLQLAKSAICAGIKTLLSEARATDPVPVMLAGGFGTALNPDSTLRIGLLPKDRVGEIKPIGNAALGGAAMLLLNKNLKEKCDLIAKTAIHVDLASSPAFSEFFMKDMMF